MALFKSGNPTLKEKVFYNAAGTSEGTGVMSINRTIQKFGFLLLMLIGSASYTWKLYVTGNPGEMMTFMIIGIIGGLIGVIAMSIRPQWSPYIAPAYAILEGFFIGGISAIMNTALATRYPNIVLQAVGLTFGVALAMFLLYGFRIIKPTQKLIGIILSATIGIAIFYAISMVLQLFHINLPFLYDSSPLGIGISLVIVAVAALNLILDFAMIEEGAKSGAPRYMEWYGAFGLLVTMVWLYIEILKLLSRFGSNR